MLNPSGIQGGNPTHLGFANGAENKVNSYEVFRET